ncbi:DUF3822 family protein [Mesohalobacter halotolerans]|uniref:DUF3822 family protein n=1 Tax=Mesohalobacter halotolerans TaxID=1883405 RepID=A0A4U5TR64_9FLAO|nr:DUF3822 family protein [Mesohalobacter halotolerans]MBS3738751.1 DUF3822 family protein [Psychroflexus sp.]TKS56442.1 DUF3822 family protein [Mesohalobacter halotolerans]
MVNKSKTDINTFQQLSILIGQDGFLFYLHHQEPQKSISLDFIAINDILSSKSLNLFQKRLLDTIHNYQFDAVKLGFSNGFYSLIPQDYYEEQAKADYLKYNVKLFEEDQIVSEHIPTIKAYQVYIPLMNYHNALLDQVQEFEFEHFTHALIKHAYPNTFEQTERLMVYIQNTSLDIVAYEGRKFKLCNTFNYETDLDLVYYILFCVEQLHFNQRTLQLELYHNSEDESAWLKMIKKYILNVKCEQKNLASLVV